MGLNISTKANALIRVLLPDELKKITEFCFLQSLVSSFLVLQRQLQSLKNELHEIIKGLQNSKGKLLEVIKNGSSVRKCEMAKGDLKAVEDLLKDLDERICPILETRHLLDEAEKKSLLDNFEKIPNIVCVSGHPRAMERFRKALDALINILDPKLLSFDSTSHRLADIICRYLEMSHQFDEFSRHITAIETTYEEKKVKQEEKKEEEKKKEEKRRKKKKKEPESRPKSDVQRGKDNEYHERISKRLKMAKDLRQTLKRFMSEQIGAFLLEEKLSKNVMDLVNSINQICRYSVFEHNNAAADMKTVLYHIIGFLLSKYFGERPIEEILHLSQNKSERTLSELAVPPAAIVQASLTGVTQMFQMWSSHLDSLEKEVKELALLTQRANEASLEDKENDTLGESDAKQGAITLNQIVENIEKRIQDRSQLLTQFSNQPALTVPQQLSTGSDVNRTTSADPHSFSLSPSTDQEASVQLHAVQLDVPRTTSTDVESSPSPTLSPPGNLQTPSTAIP